MADLLLEPTQDGGQFKFLPNGDFQTTDAIYNAGFVAALSEPYWGNQISDPTHRLKSRLNELFKGTVSPTSRNLAEEYTVEALSFLEIEGIARDIEVNAIIKSSTYILINVRVTKPDGNILDLPYGLNWEAQAAELPFGGII